MSFPFYTPLQGEQYVTSSTKKFPIGTRGITPDGRVYRYVKADQDLSYPLYCCGGAEVQSLNAGAVHNAHASGVMKVTIDGTSSGVPAAGTYDDSLIFFYESAYPTMYVMESSAAAAASPYDVTLKLQAPLPQAISDNAEVYIQPNMYAGAVCCFQGGGDSNLHIRPALGWPAVAIASGYYGWVQTWGPLLAVPTSTEMGSASGDRLAVLASDGSVKPLDEELHTSQRNPQIAGYSMAVNASGILWLFCTLNP